MAPSDIGKRAKEKKDDSQMNVARTTLCTLMFVRRVFVVSVAVVVVCNVNITEHVWQLYTVTFRGILLHFCKQEWKKPKPEAKYSCKVVQKVSAICGLKLIAEGVARWSISWLGKKGVWIGFCSRAKVIAKRSILKTKAKAKVRARAKAKPFQRDNQLISQEVNGKCLFSFFTCWLVCFFWHFCQGFSYFVFNVQTFNAVECDKASHNVAYKSFVFFLFTAYLKKWKQNDLSGDKRVDTTGN